jgi:hypothetical protein
MAIREIRNMRNGAPLIGVLDVPCKGHYAVAGGNGPGTAPRPLPTLNGSQQPEMPGAQSE